MRINQLAPAALALTLALGAVANAATSPSATNAEFNATTVQVRDMHRAPFGQGAPAAGIDPSAPNSVHNGATVPASEAKARPGITNPPRSGDNPSAASSIQDASTVN